jgi:hypothetical protein
MFICGNTEYRIQNPEPRMKSKNTLYEEGFHSEF